MIRVENILVSLDLNNMEEINMHENKSTVFYLMIPFLSTSVFICLYDGSYLGLILGILVAGVVFMVFRHYAPLVENIYYSNEKFHKIVKFSFYLIITIIAIIVIQRSMNKIEDAINFIDSKY